MFKGSEANDWDVIVVGGGPGGALAGKKCSENGFKTLILEKNEVPSDKEGTVILMGDLVEAVIREEFGQIPQEVLANPPYLSGYRIHVPGTATKTIGRVLPGVSKKDLDCWLIRKASQAGAETWDSSEVINVVEKDEIYVLDLVRDGQCQQVQGKFLIGADGATSVVRNSLWPDLKVPYASCYQECHECELQLDKDYYHMFFPLEMIPYYFCAHYEKSSFLIEIGEKLGGGMWNEAKQFLADHHGLDTSRRPLWKNAAVAPVLYNELFSGSFTPATKNALLIGDAAGLAAPISGAGIGTAMSSGRVAAEGVARAGRNGEKASVFYLNRMKGLLSIFENLILFARRINTEKRRGPIALSDILLEAWKIALKTS